MIQQHTLVFIFATAALSACGSAQPVGPAPIDNTSGEEGGGEPSVAVACDGATGPVDAGTLWAAAHAGTSVGACTVAANAVVEGEYIIKTGGHLVAELNTCAIKVLVPGVPVSETNQLTVGATAEELIAAQATGARLECNADDDGSSWWCGARDPADSFAYDPNVYFIFPAEKANGQLLADQAVAAIAGKVSTAFSVTLGCD